MKLSTKARNPDQISEAERKQNKMQDKFASGKFKKRHLKMLYTEE